MKTPLSFVQDNTYPSQLLGCFSKVKSFSSDIGGNRKFIFGVTVFRTISSYLKG